MTGSKGRVTLKHRVEYALARSVLFAVSLFPERVSYGIAGALGRLFLRFSGRRRQCALRLLRNAYPDEKDDRVLLALARTATGNLFKVPLDMVYVTRVIRKRRLEEFVEMSQARAVMPPAPFMGITPHLGSWEMGAVSLAHLNGHAHVIVRTFRNPLFTRFISENRRFAGLHLHARRGGIRALATALRNGSVGLQAADQYQRLRAVRVPFFGQVASTERSGVALALREGYPMVVGRCERVGSGFRFRLVLSEPFRPEVTGDRREDVRRAAAEVNRRMEEHILACPDQYLWIHDRYRRPREER